MNSNLKNQQLNHCVPFTLNRINIILYSTFLLIIQPMIAEFRQCTGESCVQFENIQRIFEIRSEA